MKKYRRRHQNRFSTIDDHISGRPIKSSKANGQNATLFIAKKSAAVINKVNSQWNRVFQPPTFSGTEAKLTRPVHFQNHTLMVQCDSNVAANHLRFNQQQLLKQLHRCGFDYVHSLKFTLQHRTNLNSSPDDFSQKNQSFNETLRVKPSDSAMTSLRYCSEQTSNKKLQHSLNKLYQRLKKL